MDIQTELLKRSLEENIRDLVDTSPSVPHNLLLINYNSLMDDFHKGTITAETFQVRQTRLWESLIYFSGRLQEMDQKRLLSGDSSTAGSEAGVKRILYASASPANIDNLQVDFEFKKIKGALSSGSIRDNFELLSPLMSVTLEDFLKAKHLYKPAIIHFSGHGLQDGLMFATSENVFQLVPTELLKDVFKGIEAYTEIVVLNACYSSSQAKIISDNGIWVIGMNVPVTDSAAVFFSEKFYGFLSDGQKADEIFKNIKILMELDHPEEAKTLEMWKNGKLLKF
ncbi:hypothetical protein GZH53_07040 [Flavihumibacter sp. R14]|nr:hypothetical protein [Flavihumibacter soli]